jgi:hypothetical protein
MFWVLMLVNRWDPFVTGSQIIREIFNNNFMVNHYEKKILRHNFNITYNNLRGILSSRAEVPKWLVAKPEF